MISDNFGRKFNYARLSLTDVCNFRCQYCLPTGYSGDKSNRQEFLNLCEIENLMAGLNDIGIKKVRLTGGEPTLRHDFIDILRLVSSIGSVEKVALTTNGYSLYKNVKEYCNAGLTNITISLDSLTPQYFYNITKMKNFFKILEGIEACLRENYKSIKINTVLLKGINSTNEEIDKFFNYVKDKNVTVRFIELMDTKDNHAFYQKNFLSTNGIQHKLNKENWHSVQKSSTDGPAVEYWHSDFVGKIGIISPYSNIFCQDCNRVRISSRGELYICLFDTMKVSLRNLLNDQKHKDALIDRITKMYKQKRASHFLYSGEIGGSKHFSSIGG